MWVVIYVRTKEEIPDPTTPTEMVEVYGPFNTSEEAEGWVDQQQMVNELRGHFCIQEPFTPTDILDKE